jgi:hypothetical protein
MPSTNYTITSVVYTAVSGTNVYNTHPTAVLTITPNEGYEVYAQDFSWTNTDLNYVFEVCEKNIEGKKIFSKIINEWTKVENNFEIMNLHETVMYSYF